MPANLAGECQLNPDAQLLVGVSGGPDSLCLLDILCRSGYPVVVAHYNHRLRAEADAEARYVQSVAENRGLPFVGGGGDIAAYAQDMRLSLEEAGRISRYRFLFAEAERIGAQAVAVGHTADDQVETILMHLLRGAGLDGLRGMQWVALPNVWSSSVPLVRPLLATWRTEVMDYIAERKLDPLLDATNQDPAFFRNRLRHELIPLLEQYNPAVRTVLWRTAQTVADDGQVLDRLVDAAWDECVAESGPGYLALQPARLAEQPIGIRRRLLRRAIGRLRPGQRDIGFEAVERAVQFLESRERPIQIDMIAGLRLIDESGREAEGQIWLADGRAALPRLAWPQLAAGLCLPLPVPGWIDLAPGWRLSARPLADAAAARQQAIANPDPFQAWIGSSALLGPLEVRSRRPGDRFRPLGMRGRSLKLSDFMINEKMPARARAAWPLVCAGEEVVWVPGYRLGHAGRLTDEPGTAIHLCLERRTEVVPVDVDKGNL
jgi:tRNA(Ile)-lysidine synthase